MADPTLDIAEVALMPADLTAALKEGVYLIERHVSRVSTFYLTRDGSDVKAAPLSTKTSTSQFMSPFSSTLFSTVHSLLLTVECYKSPLGNHSYKRELQF